MSAIGNPCEAGPAAVVSRRRRWWAAFLTEPLEHPLAVVAVGLLYGLTAKGVAVVTAIGSSEGAAFWPGAGVTIAALLVLPRRRWPLILGAVALAELVVDLSEGFGVMLSLSWAVANPAESLLGAALLTRAGRATPRFTRRGEVLRFVGAAVVLGPALGSLLGTAAGVAFAGDPWLPRLLRWWVGDAIGVLVVAPALIAARGERRDARMRRSSVGGVALVVATTAAVMAPWSFAGRGGLPFLVLPALLVLAASGSVRSVAFAVLATALMTDVVTALGEGPFGDGQVRHGLVTAQLFLAMTAFTALMEAALTHDLVSRDELEVLLRDQALHDGLTGLPNRRLLFDRLEEALRARVRHGSGVAVLFVDLDDLKTINDHLGHAAGDATLVEVARRVERVLRPGDTAARVGGDEFVVVLPAIGSRSEADHLVERIHEALRAPFETGAGTVHPSASIGVAVAPAGEPATANHLLRRADQAMYEVKAQRRPEGSSRPGRSDQ